MASFTDIFIRRPVLASVVSLLILLGGLQAFYKLQIRQFPELSSTTITITTIYPGANADLIKGFITTPIEQAVASTEGIDTLVSTSQQNQSVITLNLLLNANPDRAVADVLSKINQVKSVLPREAVDPMVVKQTGQGYALMYMSFNSKVLTRGADHRLPHPRRAAAPADDRRRRQCADPRRPDLRDARVARSEPHGGARRHARRRAHRACRQQLHLRRRPDQGRLGPDQHQCADLARKRQGVLAARRLDARRYADPDRRHRRRRSWPRKRRRVLGLRRAEGGVHRHLSDADRQSAEHDHRRARRHAGNPGAAAGRHRRRDRLRRDRVHPRLDLGSGEDAGRGRDHRHHRHLPVPRQLALDADPDRHHPAVADRRDDHAAGARLFDQSAHAAGARAGDRPRRRRRDRRRREHLPAHRGRA